MDFVMQMKSIDAALESLPPLGYTRIAGYERYTGKAPPSLGLAAYPPVPGEGPITEVCMHEGVLYATRSGTTHKFDGATWAVAF